MLCFIWGERETFVAKEIKTCIIIIFIKEHEKEEELWLVLGRWILLGV